jgi:hypothetical protein
VNLWILAGLFLLGLAASLALQLHIHKRLEFDIYRRTRFLNGRIKMSVQDAVDAVVAQLSKAKGEIVTKLEAAQADLQAQVDAAGVADQVDLSALTAIAQQLDDIVPDSVEVEEAVDAAVEEAVEVEEAVDEVEAVEDLDESFDEAVDEAVEEAVEEDTDPVK